MKNAAIADIDATVNYMAKITSENNFDLTLIGARLEYLRMVIANDFSGSYFENAQKLALDAAILSPADPQPLQIAAQIMIGAGDYEQGKIILEQALILEPKLKNTHKMILLRAKQYIPNFVF